MNPVRHIRREGLAIVRKTAKSFLHIAAFLFLLSFPPATAWAALEGTGSITLVAPTDGSMIVDKSPLIQCNITLAFSSEQLLVFLDDRDVTGILNVTERGFELRSFEMLPPGLHVLRITLSMPDGQELRQEFSFSTRHSQRFEEAYSANELSVVYEAVVSDKQEKTIAPDNKVTANLASTSKIRDKNWEVTFDANARYLDQSVPVLSPETKGLDLINATLRGKYNSDDIRFMAEVGDVQMNETPYTVQALARKGGNLSLGYRDFTLRTFLVKSEQTFGYKKTDFNVDINSDSILGVAGDVRLLSNAVQVGTVYVTGGENGSSFGISTAGGNKKGDVIGAYLKTDFLDRALVIEAEIDFSKFDPDTSDEFGARSDKSYHLKIGGMKGIFNYEVLYEYLGPDYQVVGNPGLRRDIEGLALRTGANIQSHSVALTFSRYNDNVKGNDLFPRMVTYMGTADYTFSGIQNFPVGIGYMKTVLDSEKEPQSFVPQKVDTDTIRGRVGYANGPWNIGLQAMYSVQDDHLNDANDTTTTTITLTPAYFTVPICVAPSFTFNRSGHESSGINMDTYTVTLDLRGKAFRERLSYELGGTYNYMKSNDGTVRLDTINANGRIAYLLAKNLWGFISPSMGMRGIYIRNNDHVSGRRNDEYVILLMLSTSIKFLI